MGDIRPSAMADEVRRLAREGLLVKDFRTADDSRRRRLRAGAGEIAGPLLFLRLTRAIERGHGHHRCATGLHRLAPNCLDRYHDDLESVLDHLFTYADKPIAGLEGWLTSRLRQAAVDGYRRRRGARGALQRPRPPVWLTGALRHDAWLVELATAILEWVGHDATAGVSLWPLGVWAERRAAHTGDHAAGEAVVAHEVELVLTTMRRRPTWYDKYVERPLGHKQAPVWSPSRTTDGSLADPEPVSAPPDEVDEALLRQLASIAIDAMSARLELGQEPAVVVAEVLQVVFGSMPDALGPDRAPGPGQAGPDRVLALIGEPEQLDRIVTAVLRVLRG